MKQLEGFGKFLESLRGKMSLREAANKSGLSHAYIRDLELERNRSTNEKINPSPVTLKKLSDAYNIPYTDLMEKAGYLELDSVPAATATSDLSDPVSMADTLYIEVSTKEITYHTRIERMTKSVNSLLDFSLFLDKLEEMGYKKMDTDLFVNMNQVQKYIEREGKLYFDPLGISKFVVIAAIRQKKYHDLIVRSVARNTGMGLEFHYDRAASDGSRISSVKRPI
ncbi:helix-turn-helix domain-containing protein [Paenibacillus sp. GCM10023248]|uniref:helix-turn-helix domain-containing protein n=1 Tax=Bacillales TaxID=1385 RepID=UPI00237930A9|nr:MULTISPECIES: helix-turn-helix transcriptional regulator [Bacillales]MDD9265764.1 helix-turn-helix transcriptional regulator [Paenibacillus sp. MAHUQ-63]MDR6879005.1 transcriptional regulator with XRE-family HTH domain [Bacillus sp. 3255]